MALTSYDTSYLKLFRVLLAFQGFESLSLVVQLVVFGGNSNRAHHTHTTRKDAAHKITNHDNCGLLNCMQGAIWHIHVVQTTFVASLAQLEATVFAAGPMFFPASSQKIHSVIKGGYIRHKLISLHQNKKGVLFSCFSL